MSKRTGNALTAAVLFTLASLPLVGCGGASQVQAQNGAVQEVPDWVQSPKAGCAAGSGKFRGDFNFAKDFAAQNARVELGKSIQTKLEGLWKQYRAEGETAAKDFTEEQSSKALRELLDMKLDGTRITRTEATAGFVWAEVCIDASTIDQYLQGMKSLDSAQRAELQARAKAAFSDLDSALDQARSSGK